MYLYRFLRPLKHFDKQQLLSHFIHVISVLKYTYNCLILWAPRINGGCARARVSYCRATVIRFDRWRRRIYCSARSPSREPRIIRHCLIHARLKGAPVEAELRKQAIAQVAGQRPTAFSAWALWGCLSKQFVEAAYQRNRVK